MSGDVKHNGDRDAASQPVDEDPGGQRLPPPAFPPGAGRGRARPPAARGDDLAGALISPDEPIPERSAGVPDDAFISPDAPIQRAPRRAPRTAPAGEGREDIDPDEGVVTGIGDDAHLDPDELALGFDPHVLEVVDKVVKLAEALKRKGEAGLRTTPDMSRFEATLRSYCVGYLAGRRAEDEDG